MIGIVDVEVQALNPSMPLYPMRAFVSSPSSIRVRNVPKRIGKWCIENVSFVVAYPDGSIKSADCVLVGGVWTGTIEGTQTSGTSKKGYTIFASGTDENGNNVTGYILGKGDVEILEADGTLSPDAPSYYVHIYDEEPETPKEGDMWPTQDGFRIWQDGTAKAFGITASDMQTYVASAISGKLNRSEYHGDYIIDSNNNRINANLSTTQTVLIDAWQVSTIYGFSCVLSTHNTYTFASYYPSNPQENDMAVELHLFEGSSWESDHIYDFAINCLYWRNGAWEFDSGGTQGLLPDGDTHFDDGLWTANYSPVIPQLQSGRIATEQYVQNANTEKQDKLNDAQITALNMDANDVYTKFAFSSVDIKDFVSNQTLTKTDCVNAGAWDSVDGYWIKQPIGIITGKNVTTLDTNVFNGLEYLMSFDGQNVQTLNAQAFYDCLHLTQVSLPNLKTIGRSAFNGCTAIQTLTLPASVSIIGKYAFQNTTMNVHFEGKTLAEVQAMANYPWGLDASHITADKDATQGWVNNNFSKVTIGNVLSSGTDIGTLTIDGVSTTLKAPAGGGGSGYTVTINNHSIEGPGGAGIINIGGFRIKAGNNGLIPNEHETDIHQLIFHNQEYVEVPVTSMSNGVYINGTQTHNKFFTLTGNSTVDMYYELCIVGGTLVSLADGTTKPIEDITYDDNLLVWNFDEGRLDCAKPTWVKRADYVFYYWNTQLKSGKTINTCGKFGHRLFDMSANTWTYASDIDGKTVYTLDGADEVVSSTRMDGKVNFYNIITKTHINLFGNGILLGCSLENHLYPVKDMKFIKDNRALRPYSEFAEDVPEWWYTDCRYAESNANKDYLVKYCKDRLPIMKDKS